MIAFMCMHFMTEENDLVTRSPRVKENTNRCHPTWTGGKYLFLLHTEFVMGVNAVNSKEVTWNSGIHFDLNGITMNH